MPWKLIFFLFCNYFFREFAARKKDDTLFIGLVKPEYVSEDLFGSHWSGRFSLAIIPPQSHTSKTNSVVEMKPGIATQNSANHEKLENWIRIHEKNFQSKIPVVVFLKDFILSLRSYSFVYDSYF